MLRTHPTVADVVAQMKTEISDSINAGEIPETVSSFSALHDYVDANMFAYSLWPDPDEDESDESADERLEACAAVFNPASDIVSAWLEAGRPADG